MSRTVIVSSETLSALIEAHASMAAWYYELWRASREGNAVVPPSDAARRAFIARLADDFPELAATARAITVPRMYVPPPPMVAPPAIVAPHTGDERVDRGENSPGLPGDSDSKS